MPVDRPNDGSIARPTRGRRRFRPSRETVAGGVFLAALAVTVAASWSAVPGVPASLRGDADAALGRRPPPRGSAVERLGRALFFDRGLSNPAGLSCAGCHAPEAGFTYPGSAVNQRFGPVPGVAGDRFGSRRPPTISYAWFGPDGPVFRRRRTGDWTGGFFADGRADTLADQAAVPLLNPDEMNNARHGLPDPDRVVSRVRAGPAADLFRQAFGADALSAPTADVFRHVGQAIAAFERSDEVSPFSSKYDAVAAGRATFTPAEEDGLRLFTGSATGRPGGPPNARSARCITCHTIGGGGGGGDGGGRRRDLFTNWTYANIGVPPNPRNPYARQVGGGSPFVDLGLGDTVYPARGLPAGNVGGDGRGDFLAANGTFRVPTLRNVDKRPAPGFVRCYMHNGVFKGLRQVVHFYNTRNLTTAGDVLDLAAPHAAPHAARGRPLWPAPEWPDAATLQNPAGRPNAPDARVGHLGLTDADEADLVAFLTTLTDGYFTPPDRRQPPPPPD